MTFNSILYKNVEDHSQKESIEPPDFFGDLNLDQIIDAITKNKQQYDLTPFFFTNLHDKEAIQYRHEIMKDLEKENLIQSINSFADEMTIVRRYLALIDKLDYHYHKEGWFLEAILVYCQACIHLAQEIHTAEIRSCGFTEFDEYIWEYTHSNHFLNLHETAERLKQDLSALQYCVILKDLTVRVRKYQDERDYSQDVENTFKKFQQGAVKDYRIKLQEQSGMNYVEARILDCVKKIYPHVFERLDSFCENQKSFVDEKIRVFDRQIQFYVAYLEYIQPLRMKNLSFCYPIIINSNKEVYAYDGFDLALANKCVHENLPIICNDFHLENKERIIVVSGPNQGGKTTFARMFGQMHYLASLGCPVPGKRARLFLWDRIFTHFERQEHIENLRGKLQDDLYRISIILEQATPNSIIIMNEIFTSTTLKDAQFLGKKILEKISSLDLLSVCVTFIDELACLNHKTISMVSTVIPENPALKTYKIIRQAADGLTYAITIAKKHQLTYDQLKERLKS